jgi:RNA polymerase sigma-70 factor, ECF subfamily
MPEPMTSDPWVEKLKDPTQQEEALTALRVRLVRGLKKAFSSAGESFAEDIAQDALIRILEKIDQFEGRSQFPTWAMSIAVRLATSQVRRKHFKDVSLEQFADGEGLKLDVAVDTVPGAAEQIEQSSIYQKLSELIDDLSDRQQTAVRAVLSGMPVEEIADRTASNRNAVYKLVHDARTKLKSGLEAAGYSAEDLTGSIA